MCFLREISVDKYIENCQKKKGRKFYVKQNIHMFWYTIMHIINHVHQGSVASLQRSVLHRTEFVYYISIMIQFVLL